MSDGVDQLRERLRQAKLAKQTQQFYSRDLLPVQGDTNSAASRQRRAKILRGLLHGLYEYKDEKRTFSSEQRRLLWNTEENRPCARCHRTLTWSDFTVNHIKSWTRGGRTPLGNPQLMCRGCNSRKGARPIKRRTAQRRAWSKPTARDWVSFRLTVTGPKVVGSLINISGS